jgi:hypothetical protein
MNWKKVFKKQPLSTKGTIHTKGGNSEGAFVPFVDIVDKGKKLKNKPTPPTVKSAKRGFDSFDSTPTGHISEKNIDEAFDILDELLAGGRTTTMSEWRKKCQAAGVGELSMWMARVEAEAIFAFEKNGNIHLKTGETETPASDSCPDGIIEDRKPPRHPRRARPVTRELVKYFRAGRGWLLEHLPELEAKGWSRKALFVAGRFKYPCGDWGAAWASAWVDPDMKPNIDGDGTLVFNFKKHGRQYRQTARNKNLNER